MATESTSTRTTVFLHPGYVYCDTAPTAIQTVLGSNVAVCLWDTRRHFGGMNHFLVPAPAASEGPTPRHGNAAIAALIGLMTEAGSATGDIVAQIYGGAYREGTESGSPVGLRNIAAARAMLEQRQIRIVSEDIGGAMGRKVVFDTLTGHVMVIKVYQLRESDWLSEER
jgi:chemotaxis protein CheD